MGTDIWEDGWDNEKLAKVFIYQLFLFFRKCFLIHLLLIAKLLARGLLKSFGKTL